MLPENLRCFNETPLKVLDQGEVQLVDVMGDDAAIVQAARVSYGEGTKTPSDDRTLIRYLMRHLHTTPFEMCELKVRVKVPMDIWRQWVRHRTASINEYSTRYSEAIDATTKTAPDAWRLQATSNKQGSMDGTLIWPAGSGRPEPSDEHPLGAWTLDYSGEQFHHSPGDYLTEQERWLHRQARDVYEERLKFGIAREQARKDLPLSTYTSAYWKIDLKNLLHFLQVRYDSHAQLEIQLYAQALAQIVEAWVPFAWEAFDDYVRHALTFSRPEQRGIALALNDPGFIERAVNLAELGKRETEELREKLHRLFTVLCG